MTAQSFSKQIVLKIFVQEQKLFFKLFESKFFFSPLLKSVLNFRRVTEMLDADLPSAVFLSSVQTPLPSRENLGLMRYRGDLSKQLVSTL